VVVYHLARQQCLGCASAAVTIDGSTSPTEWNRPPSFKACLSLLPFSHIYFELLTNLGRRQPSYPSSTVNHIRLCFGLYHTVSFLLPANRPLLPVLPISIHHPPFPHGLSRIRYSFDGNEDWDLLSNHNSTYLKFSISSTGSRWRRHKAPNPSASGWCERQLGMWEERAWG